MKVLVISVTCGQGHNSTGKAIIKMLEDKGIECDFLDAFEYINKILAKFIDDGYKLSTKYASKPYASFYRLAEHRKKNSDDPGSMKAVSTILSSKLRKYLEEYDPDVIVTTHCFAAAMVEVLKQKGIIHSTNIGIVTDYHVHPYWEQAIHFDYLVVANEFLKYQALKKGFTEEQILPIGIPIDPKFANCNYDKKETRKKLGLDPEKPTVLLMSGSMGYGNIRKTVSKLDAVQSDFQTIVVCGSNASAKAQVDKMRTEKTFLTFGFVSNVDELMAASDCIITKPGGLSTSEALAMRLPMILANPIPGQEERIQEFFLNSGAACAVTKTCGIDEIMYQMSINPIRASQMRSNIDILRKPESTRSLCDFIESLDKNK